MSRCISLFLIISCVLFLNINCETWTDVQVLENISNLTNSIVGTKKDQVNCSSLGGILTKIMQWFFKGEKSPQAPLHVTFNLYTRTESNKKYQIFMGDKFSLDNTNFRIDRKTVFIIHGFWTNSDETWIKKMKDAYLEYEDVNVFVVDWSKHSKTWNYYKAVMRALTIGQQVGQFILQITEKYFDNKNIGDIHVIGHSLGAHIAGLASEEIKNYNGKWKITRITGLDPAQPCFVGTGVTLNKNDALFVDVIHTNGKMFGSMGLGIVEEIGHIDYYINGGNRQPGCGKAKKKIFKNISNIFNTIEYSLCSHQRSCDYFTESLLIAAKKTNVKFWGHQWNGTYISASMIIRNSTNNNAKNCPSNNNCCEMGINAEKYKNQGRYFVPTARNSPYSGPLTKDDTYAILQQLKSDYN